MTGREIPREVNEIMDANASVSISGDEPAGKEDSVTVIVRGKCDMLLATIDNVYDCVQTYGVNGLSSIDNLRRVAQDLKSSLQNATGERRGIPRLENQP